jgi:RNA polymerase sigma-70 factor, ECF subfamily
MANGERNQDNRSDEELMVAFCHGADGVDGAEAAFGELFRRYRQPLFGFFRRRVADAARAEELTQDAFVAVLRGKVRYEATARFRTYLYAIGLKLLMAERRKAAFRATFFGIGASEREPAVVSTLDADVVMREAVGRLDRMDREVLLLREFEQLSYTEIAEVLRLPVNTVRSRLFRAREALREVLVAPAPKGGVAGWKAAEERV